MPLVIIILLVLSVVCIAIDVIFLIIACIYLIKADRFDRQISEMKLDRQKRAFGEAFKRDVI